MMAIKGDTLCSKRKKIAYTWRMNPARRRSDEDKWAEGIMAIAMLDAEDRSRKDVEDFACEDDDEFL